MNKRQKKKLNRYGIDAPEEARKIAKNLMRDLRDAVVRNE